MRCFQLKSTCGGSLSKNDETGRVLHLINFQGTEHTYRRGSSALALKPTTIARDDSKIDWGIGERTFKTGIFHNNAPGFQESVTAKFDMLAPCRTILFVGCNVPQLRTIRLGVLSSDGSAWVGKKHNQEDGSVLPEIGNYGPGKLCLNVATSSQKSGCLKQ
eukprot:TRINITY_DN11574_c0_g2_i2.p1 TRINITY_DN11574_c0_g2~~TRINITY_DN11574_c0_g2_i2.p1  ORF type:complete len:161 (+),score=8.87 TRINITY_DN11574_c0_g2_i2:1220-1702(+)